MPFGRGSSWLSAQTHAPHPPKKHCGVCSSCRPPHAQLQHGPASSRRCPTSSRLPKSSMRAMRTGLTVTPMLVDLGGGSWWTPLNKGEGWTGCHATLRLPGHARCVLHLAMCVALVAGAWHRRCLGVDESASCARFTTLYPSTHPHSRHTRKHSNNTPPGGVFKEHIRPHLVHSLVASWDLERVPLLRVDEVCQPPAAAACGAACGLCRTCA